MTRVNVQEAETHLIETLLSALDARESARSGRSTMLVYLAEMLVQRAREELDELRGEPTAGTAIPGVGRSPHSS